MPGACAGGCSGGSAEIGGMGAAGKAGAGRMTWRGGLDADTDGGWDGVFSFCSSSAKRCSVRASKDWRSLFRRACSSRSLSYCASLRPAVPTHWSTGLTWAPAGMTPMLVVVVDAAPPVREGDRLDWLSANANTSHNRVSPVPRMDASSRYWRWRGDNRSSRSRHAPGCPDKVFMVRSRVGSRRPWWLRRARGGGARWPRR